MTIHPQTSISHDGVTAEVDIEIAHLILELWRARLWTSMSCQDNDGKGGGGGRVWVCFAHASSLEAFIQILFPTRNDDVESMYNRAVGGIDPEDWEAFDEYRRWHFGVEPVDANEESTATRATKVFLAADVRFPRTDLDAVVEAVSQHNLLAK